MPRGRTYVGFAQAVGIGSRPSAVDLGASSLNLPGCDVKVNKSVRPRRFIRGVPGEQSKQRLQGMKGMLRTREHMSQLPKTCCHRSWASVMAAAMLRRCVACFLTGQKKSGDKQIWFVPSRVELRALSTMEMLFSTLCYSTLPEMMHFHI